MGKRSRTALVIIITAVILTAALGAVYFFVLDSFLFITDTSWSLVSPDKSSPELACNLLFRKGLRLKTVELDRYSSQDPDTILQVIQANDPQAVLLSPVITAAVHEQKLDLSSSFESVPIMGMGSAGSNYVDCLLVSDNTGGWRKAARTLYDETKTNAQNLAVIYDYLSENIVQAIVDEIGKENVTLYRSAFSDKSFYEETMDDMNRLGITIALCPYIDEFHEFFSESNTVSWVTDYRMAPAVPEDNLYGSVGPDMSSIVSIMDTVSKGSHESVSLPFEYVKQGFRSFL